jgi:hypothetical protein
MAEVAAARRVEGSRKRRLPLSGDLFYSHHKPFETRGVVDGRVENGEMVDVEEDGKEDGGDDGQENGQEIGEEDGVEEGEEDNGELEEDEDEDAPSIRPPSSAHCMLSVRATMPPITSSGIMERSWW